MWYIGIYTFVRFIAAYVTPSVSVSAGLRIRKSLKPKETVALSLPPSPSAPVPSAGEMIACNYV